MMTMKAWVIEEFGGPSVLSMAEVPTPEPGEGEVLVRVEAIAVARTKEVATRSGSSPFAPRVVLPQVLGTEHAGVVEAVGPAVDPAVIGSRVAVSAIVPCGTCVACARRREDACSEIQVIGIDRPGSYGEFTVVPAANAFPIPDGLSITQAAAMAANGPVSFAQLDMGAVDADSIVLVLGPAGALGSTAACLADRRGATVIGVDRLDLKAEFLEQLPLAAVFDGNDPELAARLLTQTKGWGVDCVVDNLGLSRLWEAYRPALAPLGRVIVSGALAGEPFQMNLAPFYVRSQALIGIRTGNRAHMKQFWTEVEAGFRLPEAAVVVRPWTEMREVHAMVEAGESVGQTVLTVGSSQST